MLPPAQVCLGCPQNFVYMEKSPSGVPAMKWLVGEDLCIGGKLCGGFVSAHIAFYWALIPERAITVLSFLEQTAANLALLGHSPPLPA